MLTAEQIIEAAIECGAKQVDIPGVVLMVEYKGELVTNYSRRLAQHFYRQGLLDGADKLDTMYVTENGAAELRQMAGEVGK